MRRILGRKDNGGFAPQNHPFMKGLESPESRRLLDLICCGGLAVRDLVIEAIENVFAVISCLPGQAANRTQGAT
jgi:hypothetical protein